MERAAWRRRVREAEVGAAQETVEADLRRDPRAEK
jgi:hypothetical protein